MDTFEGITEYLAVAETLGFSAAARKLGVSPAHVSRRISALEGRLGVQLVARTTRRVRLTDAGREYHQRCSEMMQRLEEANQRLSGEMAELEGRLRISMAGEFAERYVVPALADFALEHPKVSIEIDFSSRVVDFVEDGIDFAIRSAPLSDSDMVARKLAERTLVAAATPDYFAEYGHPERPEDLVRHRCLPCESNRWHFDTRRRGQRGPRPTALAVEQHASHLAGMPARAGDRLSDALRLWRRPTRWFAGHNARALLGAARLHRIDRVSKPKISSRHGRRAVEYLLERSKTWKSD